MRSTSGPMYAAARAGLGNRLVRLTLVVALTLMVVAGRGVAAPHDVRAQIVDPFVDVFPVSGTQNTTYSVVGDGFQRFDAITIHFTDPAGNDFPFGTTLLGVTSDRTGSFQAQVRPGEIITRGVNGIWIVQACDTSGTCAGNDVAITIVGSAPATVAPRPAPAPAPATQAHTGSIGITPADGRQTDTFTIFGVNWAPFEEFTLSFSDPIGNGFDWIGDDGRPVVTADSTGNFIITFRPITDFTGAQSGQWGVAACQVSTLRCISASFTIRP